MNLPTHLAKLESQGIVAGEPVAQFELGTQKNFNYLIIDWDSREVAWIDPQKNIETILVALQAFSLQLKSILLTHTHHDHVAGLLMLVRRFRQLSIYGHQADFGRLDQLVRRQCLEKPFRGEPTLDVGRLKVQALHTPGHSPGECCYFLEAQGRRYLFSGDTLFIRDCGRTDFDDGSDEQMFESLQKIKQLPLDTIILPGHHYQPECASTLEAELETSPPLQARDWRELAGLP